MKKSLLFSGLLSLSIILSACGEDEVTEVKQQEETTDQEQEANIQETESNQEIQSETNEDGEKIATNDFYEPHKGMLEHIHGIGYVGNQNTIFFATHDGLKAFEDGNWYKTKEQNNDYMGFNAVDKGFYTSGHPGKGVNLPDPLGLKRSFDYGQTLENLGLEGESDFHAMGVGYNNHTVYVLNGHKNSIMGEGLYVTKDDGETWEKLEANNIGEDVFNISVHPSDDKLIAVATKSGVSLSMDGGQNFSLLTSNEQGTTTFFTEEALWYGSYRQEPVLVKYILDNKEKETIALPPMEQDAVMYFAQNPQNPSELVFTSFKGEVYLSEDGANTWKPLVKEGKTQ